MTTIGGRLRQIRTRRVLTQEQLAAKVGIPVVTISRIENNRTLPRATTVQKLAAALDVESAWLMFGEEQTSKWAA